MKVEISKDGMRIFGECKELSACEVNQKSTNACYYQLYTKAQSAEMASCVMLLTGLYISYTKHPSTNIVIYNFEFPL